MSECKCDVRTKLVGDGCAVCNPALAYEFACGTIEDLQAELAACKRRLAEAEALLREARLNLDFFVATECGDETNQSIALTALLEAERERCAVVADRADDHFVADKIREMK